MIHGEAGNCYVPRLVNKTRGNFIRPVHEEWKGATQTQNLSSTLNHYPHQTVKEFIEEVNKYSDLNAEHFFNTGKKTNALDILFTPLLNLYIPILLNSVF